MLSLLMGVWALSNFIAGKGYAYIYKFTLKFDMILAYSTIAVILFIGAILLYISDKKLSSLVEEPKKDNFKELSINK